MNNERNQPRKRVDFLQAKVDNYSNIQLELNNPLSNISYERKQWLIARATALATDIDQVTEMWLTELLQGTQILRST